MVKRSIANVLGCLIILSIISGCSSMPKQIVVSAEPIEKPKLILPKSDELDQSAFGELSKRYVKENGSRYKSG